MLVEEINVFSFIQNHVKTTQLSRGGKKESNHRPGQIDLQIK